VRRTILTATAVVAAVVALPGVASAEEPDTTVVVTDFGHHWFAADTRESGKGEFVGGPGTPPAGSGSFSMVTEAVPVSGKDKVQLMTDLYEGTLLTDLDELTYSTYLSSASPTPGVARPAINLRVDTNDADTVADAYFVYEPYHNDQAALEVDVWQEWDALAGGEARWWVNNIAGPAECSQAAPCSWTTLTTVVRPGATLGSSPDVFRGGLGVNVGSGNPGQIAAVDALTVGVGGESTRYDFENARTLLAKADCKGNNWTTFNAPAFRNQGECVSLLMSARSGR
jgi:hypothetical protein